MTLGDLLSFANEHPEHVVFYLSLLPFAALLAGWMQRGEGHLPPWNYLFSTLLYLVAVPTVLSVAYTAYRWLFDRGSILDADLLLQVLPVISFVLTAWLIQRRVALRQLPGFGRLSGLVTMIAAAMLILYGLDRMNLVLFSSISFPLLLVVFLTLLWAIYRGFRRVGGN